MDDEEFYNMYEISREKLDDEIEKLSLFVVEKIMEIATVPVKKEVRMNPNDEELKRQFAGCVEHAKKKLYEKTDENWKQAITYAFKGYDEIMRNRRK